MNRNGRGARKTLAAKRLENGRMFHPLISICIPTYEMGGNGARFLHQNLSRIARQDYDNYEVIISDQSDDLSVKSVCDEFSDVFHVVYLDEKKLKRQASANTNNAINHARGEIIKIIFQDDFLIDDSALSKISTAFADPEIHWLVSGCDHTYDGKKLVKPFRPSYNDLIYLGKNTISSPSVLSFRKNDGLLFDENLEWLMDVDYYKRYFDLFGPPYIIEDNIVANRIHGNQVSKSISSRLALNELKYVYNKFPKSKYFVNKFLYLKLLFKYNMKIIVGK